VRLEAERINREVPGVTLTVLDDSSRFIKRSINAVQEHALVGGVLVMLVIFAFLRNLRATFIIFTSIPVSVIGTFALLFFNGYTLNTMTFGGLALGIGMIVDASIVVIENTFRHMEHGQGPDAGGHRRQRGGLVAILASTLTHIAVFVPLLFLTGVSSILFKQLAVVVMFSLMMSLFVAVTIVPVLCSRLLRLPKPASERSGVMARAYGLSERFLNGMDAGYSRLLHRALVHRPTVIGLGTAAVVAAFLILPTIGVELMPVADEGEVTVTAELPVGTRVERAQDVASGSRASCRISCPRGGHHRRRRRVLRRQRRAHQRPVLVTPKAHVTGRATQIARDLSAQLASAIPGVIIATRASGGNRQMNRIMGGGDSRLSLEIRGDDLDTRQPPRAGRERPDGSHARKSATRA
jgi:hydrophobic/amphiphilic exporter-1 (mainly G- bacteria), HAE1 family